LRPIGIWTAHAPPVMCILERESGPMPWSGFFIEGRRPKRRPFDSPGPLNLYHTERAQTRNKADLSPGIELA
jgi:hypothetical protein